MKKVIIDRPRIREGCCCRYRKHRNARPRNRRRFESKRILQKIAQFGDSEELGEALEKREGISTWIWKRPKDWWAVKGFSDRLNPLRRALEKSARQGLLWNDVWSDICTPLRHRRVVDDHLKTHVRRLVEENVQVRYVDGKPLLYRGGNLSYSLDDGELFVHPETGRLQIYQEGNANNDGGC